MTNSEWLRCTDPEPMVALLLRKRSRKMRLAAVAACRLFSGLLFDPRSEEALEVAERFADHQATEEELAAARDNARAAGDAMDGAYHAAVEAPGPTSEDDENFAYASSVARAVGCANSDEPERAISALPSVRYEVYFDHVANILRDVFGPLTPVPCSPSWLTPEVVALAGAIYNDRTFAMMPDLAAALEGAGCREPAVLEHCRLANDHYGLGQHWRGCWVLDLLLRRS